MQTPLQITYHGLDPSPAMDALIRQRAGRLEQFHGRITSCRVVVAVPHRAQETAKVPIEVKVEVLVPGRDVIVAADSDERREMKGDQMAPLNDAFDAIERQLRKA